jgi:hypothetical protein
MFAAMSTTPEFFNKRINIFAALAPVARVDKAKSQRLQDVAWKDDLFSFLIEDMDYEVMPSANASNVLKGMAVYVFQAGPLTFKTFSDGDLSVISKTGMDNYMGHYPAGASHREILHFA